MSDDYDISDRWQGIGTHHDRFLSHSEMLWIGIGLWRTASWFRENQRRLSPMEKAMYEVEVERWKRYLEWEAQTPGAQEAREQLMYEMEIEEANAQQVREAAWRTRWAWRPLTLLFTIIWVSNFIPHREHVFIPVGFALWWATWRFCRKVKRLWIKARTTRLAQEEYERLHPEPSRYLPVLWKPQP